MRRSAYHALGGICKDAAALGDQAVLLELTERALTAGWLVALRDAPGLEQNERSASLNRTRARAALLAHRARERGERPPVAPAVARLAAGALPGGPTFVGGVAHGVAWLAGLLDRAPAAEPNTPSTPPNVKIARSEGLKQRLPG
jgi:hypothetical protein